MSLADKPMDSLTKRLADALEDMHSGWRYIRQVHGDLYGVGWDRAENKATKALEEYRNAVKEAK